jgi:hypothetical protein
MLALRNDPILTILVEINSTIIVEILVISLLLNEERNTVFHQEKIFQRKVTAKFSWVRIRIRIPQYWC